MNDHNDPSLTFLDLRPKSGGRRIAVRALEGDGPGLLWLGGLKSDMKGTKAQALAEWAARHGRACIRFDYSGHGESSGAFADGTIGEWLEDATAVFEALCRGPQILIGSSMGGWIALLLIRALRQRSPASQEGTENISPDRPTVAGLVLIAPAVDFTEVLMWQQFPRKVQREIEQNGYWERPSAYSEEPYRITRQLIEEGRNHLLLGDTVETGCPVRILQGVKDPDVPWNHAVELVSRCACDDVVLTLVKDGDHRLSRPEDIERLLRIIEEISGEIQMPAAGGRAPA